MTDIEIATEIVGASDLIARFGRWPSFHDSEIVELCLHRSEPSILTIHIFRMTSKVSRSGHYICDLHTLVTFSLKDVTGSELFDFNHQNVISELVVDKQADKIKLTLGSCHGLSGFITASKISLTFIEGLPPQSIYQKAV